MFIYTDFKKNIKNGDFEAAKKQLKDADIDTAPFTALANSSMFLSLLFRYPDDNVYDLLRDNWESFSEFLNEYQPDFPGLYDQTEMQSDFIKLFKQDFKGSKVVPYISYYTEENKTLYGESTFKIREWMAAEGFALDTETPDLEDNIYIVLEFFSALFGKLAQPENIEKWYSTFQNLYRLTDTYGVVITDEFAAKVKERTAMPFYAACGTLLQGFISDFDEILEDVLSSGE
jgi:TorA maturation chaperone TorD